MKYNLPQSYIDRELQHSNLIGYDSDGNPIFQPKNASGSGPYDKGYTLDGSGTRQNYSGKILDRAPGGSGADPNLTTPQEIGGSKPPPPTDRQQIEDEAGREKQQTLDAVNQAADLRTKGIGSLGDILQKQNQAQFNYDLPGIKEDLSNSGLFSSPSALASAVARESGMLGANTQSTLAQAGLGNIDLQAQGLLGATQNQTQMQQSGLQRQFSVADYDKQAQLAREIGAMSVPNAPGPLSGFFGGAAAGGAAGAPFGPWGAGIGAGIGGIAGMSKNCCHICTYLYNQKLITKIQYEKLHKILAKAFYRHPFDYFFYHITAPIFIIRANEIGFDWSIIKNKLCDEIINCTSSEKAYGMYKKSFLEVAGKLIPELEIYLYWMKRMPRRLSHGY